MTDRPDQPLTGIRVLDLSRLIGGALVTQKLSDLGADVVKVEQPGRGDYLREVPPFLDGVGMNHLLLNRGKRSIALDLRQEGDRVTVDHLVSQADVVVEVSRPGRLAELGFDVQALQDLHPKLVICSLTGFGQVGEWAGLPAHGMNIDALAGLMSIERRGNGRMTIGSNVAFGLELGALNAAVAINAALVEVARGGKGRLIDISCWDASLAPSRLELAHRRHFGTSAITARDLGAFYDVYRAADERLVLFCAIEAKFWEAFCEAAGRPDLIDRWDSSSTVDYGADADLRPILDEIFAMAPAEHWQQMFNDHGIPGCAVLSSGEAFDQQHFADRDLIEHSSDDQIVAMADPIRWGDGSRPGAHRRPAPEVDQDRERVLADWGAPNPAPAG